MGDATSGRLWVLGGVAVEGLANYLASVRAEHQAAKTAVPADAMPSVAELDLMMRSAFFASMIPDEGRFSRFTLAFFPPVSGCFRLTERRLTADAIAGLAPATASGARIGIRRNDAGDLVIWGLVPAPTPHIEIRGHAPGHIVVARGTENLAVLKHDEYRSLLQPGEDAVACHGLGRERVASIVGNAFATTQTLADQTITGIVLLMALDAMRSHGNGGTLLVVPSEVEDRDRAFAWLNFGLNRLAVPETLGDVYKEYGPQLASSKPLAKAYEVKGLGAYLRGEPEEADTLLVKAARVVGSLTAVDGAVVVSERLDVLGFGAKIRAPPGHAEPVSRITRRRLLDFGREGREAEVVPISDALGGTRIPCTP